MEKHKTKPVEQDFLTQETGLKPVFIVGMPRTGSKIYQFAINDNSEVKISHEIFFLAPQWSRKDVQSIIRDEIGALDNDQSLEQLADMIFARKFNGTYWNLIDGDRQKFLKLLRDCDRSSKAVLKCILEFDALKDGKSMIGAKFPVHITDADTLLNWFPGARIVHLNRNPLAIYSSQKKKHGRGAKSFPGKIISLLKVLLGTVASYRSSTRFYLKHHQKENYALFNYEDLVQDPEAQIRKMKCSTCHIGTLLTTVQALYPGKVESEAIQWNGGKKRLTLLSRQYSACFHPTLPIKVNKPVQMFQQPCLNGKVTHKPT